MTITHHRSSRPAGTPRLRLSNWIAIAVCLLALASLMWPRIFPSAEVGQPQASRADSLTRGDSESAATELGERPAADGSAAVLSNRQWIDQVDQRLGVPADVDSVAERPSVAPVDQPDRAGGSNSSSGRDGGASWSGAVSKLRPEEYLQAIGGGRYRSPAGLVYAPGSEHGHRLLHIQRHLVDEPSRPGPHGVFNGSMEDVVQLIDRTYEAAQRGDTQVKVTSQGRRDTYEADVGEVIGFVGGQRGEQRGHPKTRRVRVVLDGRNVITAFPY
jgi:hypothetical protein